MAAAAPDFGAHTTAAGDWADRRDSPCVRVELGSAARRKLSSRGSMGVLRGMHVDHPVSLAWPAQSGSPARRQAPSFMQRDDSLVAGSLPWPSQTPAARLWSRP